VARIKRGPLREQCGKLNPQRLDKPSRDDRHGRSSYRQQIRAVLRGTLDGLLVRPKRPRHFTIKRPARLRCRRVPPATAFGGRGCRAAR
jgi:hypothetical protein